MRLRSASIRFGTSFRSSTNCLPIPSRAVLTLRTLNAKLAIASRPFFVFRSGTCPGTSARILSSHGSRPLGLEYTSSAVSFGSSSEISVASVMSVLSGHGGLAAAFAGGEGGFVVDGRAQHASDGGQHHTPAGAADPFVAVQAQQGAQEADHWTSPSARDGKQPAPSCRSW
ncbi:hypothetical protein G6F57_017668 [Rhizopus arrhizus]|nr:hypothetical protein G6F57_017668 [Rhizopus arrhizus]